ncbi:hypothetical protein Aperf_G00000117772 [Anoplocephala perfoliata]
MDMCCDKLGYPYTKPRVPISAMITGPGPIYKLPPLVGEIGHDFESTHIKAPGYSFGRRTKPIQVERSPGPAAYGQDAKVTTHGVSVGPSYSLKQRLDKLATTAGPGPARYLPNDDAIHPRSPEFQFGLRPQVLRKNPAPAPNTYSLPAPDVVSGKVSAPHYTLGGRNPPASIKVSPGPADYSVGSPEATKPAAPKYSMGAQLPEPTRKKMPGPAEYGNINVSLTKPHAPQFSIGIYHSPYMLNFIDKRADVLYEC